MHGRVPLKAAARTLPAESPWDLNSHAMRNILTML